MASKTPDAAPEVVRRRYGAPVSMNRAKELGVSALAVVMRHLPDAARGAKGAKDPAATARIVHAPLQLLHEKFARMEDLALMVDWSPPPPRPTTECVCEPSAAAASSKKSDEYAAANALKDGALSWLSSSGKSGWWSVDLPTRSELSSVVIVWRRTGMPETMELDVSDTSSAGGASWKTLTKLTDKTMKEETVLTFAPGAWASRVRVSVNGHAGAQPQGAVANTDGAIGISRVRVYTYADPASYTPAPTTMRALVDWMVRVVDAVSADTHTHAPASAPGAAPASGTAPGTVATRAVGTLAATHSMALAALLEFARVNGSLCTVLRACRSLLAHPNQELDAVTATSGAALVNALARAVIAQDARASENEYFQKQAMVMEAAPAYGPLPGLFDHADVSSGVTVLNAGRSVKSSASGNSYALVNIGPFTEGKAMWEFKLDEDTSSQCSCFGAAVKPVESANYENSSSMWMYRAYNGYRYSRGTCNSSGLSDSDKVRKGDTIRFELDMEERDGVISAFINGRPVSGNPIFTGLKGREIWPAVAFYSSERQISLVAIEGPQSMAPGGASAKGRRTAAVSSVTNCSVGRNDVVSLCDLAEHHSSVGHGSFGKNGDLGFGKTPEERKVKVAGAVITQSLSLHPPAATTSPAASAAPSAAAVPDSASTTELLKLASTETSTTFAACGTAVYGLDQAYEQLTGSVALNDSANTEVRSAADASPVFFEIYGDGKRLWRSAPFHVAKTPMEVFSVSVVGVRVLRLVTRCTAGNNGAHAVWLQPQLSTAAEWTYRGWRNARRAMVDALSGTPRRGALTLPAPQVLGLARASALDSLSGASESKSSEGKHGEAADASSADPTSVLRHPAVQDWLHTSHGLAHGTLVFVGLLAAEYLRDMRSNAEPVNGTASVDLEAPYAVEASALTLEECGALLATLSAVAKAPGDTVLAPSQAARAAAAVITAATASVRRAMTSGLTLVDTELATPVKRDEGKGLNKSKAKDLDKAEPATKAAADASHTPVPVLSGLLARLAAAAAWGGHAAGTLLAATGAATVAPPDPVLSQEECQAAIWQFMKLTRDAVLPSKTEQAERVRALTSTPGVIEFDVQFPCEIHDDAGNFVGVESILLQVQLLARSRGWNSRILGAWPSRVSLVVDVPTHVDAFLEKDLPPLFARLGVSSWWHALLGNDALPVCVERCASWPRAELAVAPGAGTLHVYSARVAAFADVVEALERFFPSLQDDDEVEASS